ncbi:MAG: PIN domain-containing protein [Betaproteobacteria bacterium]|nr:PIN domain-containing protein [Betaproteobacteria bacterium]
MKAADTSVVVAAFASWHQTHDAARGMLDAGLHLIEHCSVEAYSVLTRLPPPHRAPGNVVRDFLAARFAGPFLRMSPAQYREFVFGLPDRAVTGGAAYDALVAATAAATGVELVSCDRRALPTYERYGIRTHIL